MSGTDSYRREPLSSGGVRQGQTLTGRKLKERALDLLSRRDHSKVELRQKLIQKGTQVEEIGPLLDELEDIGYLDDRRFAESFVRFRAGKAWGRRRYGQELAKRGVDSEIATHTGVLPWPFRRCRPPPAATGSAGEPGGHVTVA